MSARHTESTFIEAARKRHGDTYDYSKVKYRKIRIPVVITCRIHGDFEQRPHAHIGGAGCKKCANEGHRQRMTGNHHRVRNSNRVIRLVVDKQQAADLLAWLASVPTDQDDPQIIDTLIASVKQAAI